MLFTIQQKWNLQVFLKQKNRSYFSAFQKRWDLAERSSWNMWCKWIGYGSNNCKWIDVILRSKNIVFNNVGIFSSIQLLWKSYITFSIPSTSHNPLLNWCATYNHFIPVFKNIAYDIYLECLYYKNHLEWSDFKIFEKKFTVYPLPSKYFVHILRKLYTFEPSRDPNFGENN